MGLFASKRFMMTFVVVLLWLFFGVSESIFMKKPDFVSLTAYFSSLAGIVGSYLWGESVRQSTGTTPLYMKGKNSKREVIMYVTIACWGVMGVLCKVFTLNIVHISAYFAGLTPFVSGYILATTYKPVIEPSSDQKNQEFDQSAKNASNADSSASGSSNSSEKDANDDTSNVDPTTNTK